MSQIDPAERLLNLIIALSHARTRLTRAQIMATVHGYEVDTEGLSEAEATKRVTAFERMFERDKDELRRLGVPLHTVVDEVHGDEIGYRIDPSLTPIKPLDLTPAELAVLSLAYEYWSDAAVGAEARQAVTKIVSAAPPVPRIELPLALRSASSSEAFVVLADAISRRTRVHFEYRSATASGLVMRTVEPWQLQVGGGAQYLVGWDVDREAPRTFRLSRMVGPVTVEGPEQAFSIPDPLPAAMDAPGAPRTARVGLRPGAGHAWRERGRVVGHEDGWDLVDVPYRHSDALLEELFRLGGAARVVAPAELAAVVREHAAAALELCRG